MVHANHQAGDRRRATALVAAAYACSGVLALLVGRALEDTHPVLVAFAADCAATVAVFAFSMAFDNSSFYDAYWSVLPFPLVAYWAAVAPPEANAARQALVLLLLGAWGLRLTWNWYRQWQGLGHEDWRYVDIRRSSGRAWPLASLAGIHFFPTLLVFAALLPAWQAVQSPRPLGFLDFAAFAVGAGATVVEAVADEQLRRHVRERRDHGEILASGLWKYSRHPNYFGENSFWWGIALFGVAVGPAWWSLAGAVAMTALFVFVSVPLLDRRSLERRPGYREHMERVPGLLPRLPRD